MRKVFIYFLIHLCCVDSKITFTLLKTDYHETERNIYDEIAKCIIPICGVTLKSTPTITIDTRNIKDQMKENTFIEVVVHKLMENMVPTVIITNETDTSKLDDNLVIENDVAGQNYTLRDLVIISFEVCDDITAFEFNEININIKHLIVISDSASHDCIEDLKKIKYLVYKYDVTFILMNIKEDQNKVLTFMPEIDKNTCKEVVNEPSLINTCVNGTLHSKDVFPSKNPVNLNKCPLRVGMATQFPFSVLEHEELYKTYDSINETKGSDMEIVKIVTEFFNATLDLRFISKTRLEPKLLIHLLLNASLDICAGGIYRIFGDVVGYSGVYIRQAISWIYNAERVDRSWTNLVRKVDGLYIFLIFYISYSVIWYLICVFDGDAVSIKNILLYSWGALVGSTSLPDARSAKQKILNLGYLLMCIHVSAYISIQLYSFLTILEPPQIFNTNEEIMESGRVPYLHSRSKLFIKDKRYQDFANTSNDCDTPTDCIERAMKHNGITMILQGNFYPLQSATAVNGEARLLRVTQNLLTVYNEMLIRKDSPLLKKFHDVTERLFEAGITRRLFDEAIGILVLAKANSANRNIMTNSYSCQTGCSITLTQLAGVFYLWIFGCTLSCVAFIFEMFKKREKI